MKKILLILLIFLILGCSSIDKTQAEAKAVVFVKSNVKFYAREENSTSTLGEYKIERLESTKESGGWNVAMHVSSTLGNETKQNDIVVSLDNSGNVLSLNGKKIKGK